MMKKNGFTLAEVLITLAIIGVVATLTLPALMTNTGEQQAKTALKKGINILTEAAQMNSAIAGFDYASLKDTTTDDDEAQSLYALLSNRASVDYQRTGAGNDEQNKPDAKKVAAGSTTNFIIFFRDGSAISYDPTKAINEDEAAEMEEDNLPYGIPIVFDTNGAKGPNLLSNCKGTTNLEAGDTEINDKDGNCTKANRVIKDQFGLRLRGSYVVPNGAAARWAFDN